MKTIYTSHLSNKNAVGINNNTLFQVSVLEGEDEYSSNALELEFLTRCDGDSSTIVRIHGITPSQVRSMIEVLTNALPHIGKQYQGQK